MFGGVLIVLAIPIAGQVLLGQRFLDADVEGMSTIAETRSYWNIVRTHDWRSGSAQFGTWLVLALPATVAFSASQYRRKPTFTAPSSGWRASWGCRYSRCS